MKEHWKDIQGCESTEIIHESMLKALENYKVSSELFDVATEYIRNTLPRFDKKFPVKSNEISAAIFFGANWERQRILDKTVYVVTRCEEHSDYVEKVFLDENKAIEYCKQFKGNENEYGRDITKIEVTL